MRNPLNEGKALWPWVAAVLLSCVPFLLPLYNPDLFWHLSAGRWMASHGSIVREEFLSYTLQGTPWQDFEWLSQVVYYGVHRMAGWAGLWSLKVSLMLVSAGVLVATLRLYGVPGSFIAAGVVAWSAGNLPRADLRPEQFSVIAFSLLFLYLERLRLTGGRPGPKAMAAVFAGFSLWTNFHAGAVLGFFLIACYLLSDACERRWSEAVGVAGLASIGFLGTLVNPGGIAPYFVTLEHWGSKTDLSRHIQEWSATTFGNMFHQPFWLVLAVFLVAVVLRLWSAKKRGAERVGAGRFPTGPVLAAAVLGLVAVRHVRFGAFFIPLAVPLILHLAARSGRLAGPWAGRSAAAMAACYAVFLGAVVARLSWPGFYDARHVPVAAAEFAAANRPVFEGLRLYNPWEWGGYLGWRLGPWHKVFDDGRYIFHSHLPEIGEAVKSVEKTRIYVDKQGFDGLFLRNIKSQFATRKAYRDGSTKNFMRPWYLFSFPKERWALVYWDEQAMIFLDRRKAPASWLASREYKWVRPHDDEAFAEALERKEIPAKRVAAEARRHEDEVRLMGAAKP
ncbi:MAG: hypothetical protein HY924_15925 [Elusimicrobia bacterium]|nr:hypothetical protein [Elusimicrobiota bacterium]